MNSFSFFFITNHVLSLETLIKFFFFFINVKRDLSICYANGFDPRKLKETVYHGCAAFCPGSLRYNVPCCVHRSVVTALCESAQAAGDLRLSGLE